MVDFKGELALAPVIDAVNLATLLNYSTLNALHYAITSFVGCSGINKEQQFIGLHMVTSFGLTAPGREGCA